MNEIERLAKQHNDLTRRYFLKLGAAGIAGASTSRLWAGEDSNALLAKAVSRLEYLTKDEDFINFGRGKPPPHTLPPEKLREVGLVPETWQLEVVPDSDSNAEVAQPLTKAAGTALDWAGFMKLAETKAVRFMFVVSCTNGNKPCGMGLWEGVPLRDVIWLVKPTGNVRRVFYYGYHNDDPKQMFRSSLPIGRVLEDPPGENPVILCYKLNNRLLTPKRGGPVRMLVPDGYGNKSVKWLQRIVLTNNPKANDTYAEWNNDTVSHIKTCARFIHTPKQVKAGQLAPITGLAQVGMSGLSKVQYLLTPADSPREITASPISQGKPPADNDPYFTNAPWKDAEILPPPKHWGGELDDGQLPPIPSQFDAAGKPLRWPLPNTIVHWAAVLKPPDSGKYDLRCRTIDANGIIQPMPRPFPKSGHNAIQKVQIVVEE
jgi:DMSO/TMAO reductase YedYZ molybdopterin-dependent catalytic subunit